MTSINTLFRGRLLTVLGLLVICMGATSSSCSTDDSDDGDGTGGDEPDFVTELDLRDAAGQTSDAFERGALIQMVLTVRNRRNETVSVEFPTTRQFDFIVVRENTSDIVWQLSDVAAPPSSTPTTLQFAPGETRTFTTTWNQQDSEGTSDQVRTGAYEARGVLVYSGFDSNPLRANQLGSTLERFTIN